MDAIEYRVNKIYENGDHYLSDILKLIESAKKSVFVESYIFELPQPGQQILRALEIKQREGLEIKVLVDGVGSLHHVQNLLKWSENSWIPVHVYNPLPWRRRWRIIFFPIFLLNLLWKTRSLNRRDHRKMVVIDEYFAFLGSINFAKVHFTAFSARPWFDLAVQVEGQQVSILARAFRWEFDRVRPGRELFWPELKRALPHRTKLFPLPHKLRLNNQFILRFLFWRDLLRRIRRAEKRVIIMNAYFVPHRTLMRSLSVAARRGAQVQVLLPSESDVPVVKWFAPIFYRRLIRSGVEIREMQNQMIHTKTVIVDDWALVGSNNLNYRSLIHDLEVEAVVAEPSNLETLLSLWGQKLQGSRVIRLSEVIRLSWWEWLRYRLVLLIRYFV